MTSTHAGLTVALALAAGVVAQGLARQIRLPGIVLLLALGAALGPELLGWIDPDSLGHGLYSLVDFAVAVILFEGGMNLELTRLRRQESAIRKLITVGAAVTLFGAAGCAYLILGWSVQLSLLFGSLVVVTGPTVVTPLLRETRVRQRVKTVLEAEGVLIDPIGAILAVLVLQSVSLGGSAIGEEARDFVLRLGFGVGAGALGGFLMSVLLNTPKIVPRAHANIFALAAVVLLFHGGDAVVSQSGILAVTVAGVVVGNLRSERDHELREFKDQLTVMLVGLLFILLAAGVEVTDLQGLGWGGPAVILALVLAVRPVGVFISTRGSGLTLREKLFISWLAPRGIVAAAVASLTVAAMDESGLEGGAELEALVFMTIAGTVVLAGVTARPVASLLGLRLPRRDRTAILGAQGLGFLLARELVEAGVPVVFLDSDPLRCRRAEEAGHQIVYGDALEERTILRAQVEQLERVVGMTGNEHLNTLFVGQTTTNHGVPEALVALSNLGENITPDRVARHEASVLFEGAHDVERWDVRYKNEGLEVERFEYRNDGGEDLDGEGEEERSVASLGRNQEAYVMLTHERDGPRESDARERGAEARRTSPPWPSTRPSASSPWASWPRRAGSRRRARSTRSFRRTKARPIPRPPLPRTSKPLVVPEEPGADAQTPDAEGRPV